MISNTLPPMELVSGRNLSTCRLSRETGALDLVHGLYELSIFASIVLHSTNSAMSGSLVEKNLKIKPYSPSIHLERHQLVIRLLQTTSIHYARKRTEAMVSKCRKRLDFCRLSRKPGNRPTIDPIRATVW